MNDKELLKLAAKAAGIHRDTLDCEWYDTDGHVRPDWNPLTDDGDALRLAVKICMYVNIGDGGTVTAASLYNEHKGVEDFLPDPYAATRRAIVRAAAEIGKTM